MSGVGKRSAPGIHGPGVSEVRRQRNAALNGPSSPQQASRIDSSRSDAAAAARQRKGQAPKAPEARPAPLLDTVGRRCRRPLPPKAGSPHFSRRLFAVLRAPVQAACPARRTGTAKAGPVPPPLRRALPNCYRHRRANQRAHLSGSVEGLHRKRQHRRGPATRRSCSEITAPSCSDATPDPARPS